MNVSEYIASGILEVYVLGELPASEATEVEDMAARYPEIRQEIVQIQNTYEALANELPVSPRPALKDEIMNRLVGKEEATSDASETPPSAEEPTAKTSPSGEAVRSTSHTEEVSPRSSAASAPSGKHRSMLPFKLGIAASVVVALLSMAAALYFRTQWKETEQELDQVVAQNQEIASQYESTSQRAQQLENDLSIVESPDFQQIALAGTDLSPESSAKVYWNRTSSQVYLNAGNLPAPPNDKQYQLWAIVDGQPVSAGVFDLTADGRSPLQAMSSSIQNAGAFAITLEPRGGSESPTLEAMYVQGAVADS